MMTHLYNAANAIKQCCEFEERVKDTSAASTALPTTFLSFPTEAQKNQKQVLIRALNRVPSWILSSTGSITSDPVNLTNRNVPSDKDKLAQFWTEVKKRYPSLTAEDVHLTMEGVTSDVKVHIAEMKHLEGL